MANRRQVKHLFAPEKEAEWGWSTAVEANGFVFLAGIGDVTEDGAVGHPGDMGAQLASVYDQVEAALALYGATLEHVVQEKWFTTDIDALAEVWPRRRERYGEHALPATAGCQVERLDIPGLLVEVMATAVVPSTNPPAREGDE